jgi:hypothetical protein
MEACIVGHDVKSTLVKFHGDKRPVSTNHGEEKSKLRELLEPETYIRRYNSRMSH